MGLLYANREATYTWPMLGLTPGELAMVITVFLLVAGATRLPSWGETLGGYLHRRKETSGRAPEGRGQTPRRD